MRMLRRAMHMLSGVLAAPVLSSMNYSQGDRLGGGASIVLTGSNFTGCTPRVDGVAVGVYTVDSPTQITFTLPPHAAGVVNVDVTGPGGTSGTLAFEYWDPLLLTSTTIMCEDWDGSASWAARGGSVPDTLSRVATGGLTQGVGAGGFQSAQGAGGGNSGRFQSTSYIDAFYSQQPGMGASIIWALAKPTSSAPMSAGAPYVDRAIIGTNAGGYIILSHNDEGFSANVFDGTYDAEIAPCTLGTGTSGLNAWHMAVMRTAYDNGAGASTIAMSVDGSAFAANERAQNLSATVGSPYLLQIMTDYSGGTQFGGEVLAFGLTKGNGTDADVLKLRKWGMQRFGVTL